MKFQHLVTRLLLDGSISLALANFSIIEKRAGVQGEFPKFVILINS